MAIGGANSVFLDTNVLVYSTAIAAPMHGAARQRIGDLVAVGHQIVISSQTVREYLATVTRPQSWSAPLSGPAAVADILRFQKTMSVVNETGRTRGTLYQLLRRYPVGGKQVHDANIVATMIAYQIPTLVTHNLADFARFSGFITIEPIV